MRVVCESNGESRVPVDDGLHLVIEISSFGWHSFQILVALRRLRLAVLQGLSGCRPNVRELGGFAACSLRSKANSIPFVAAIPLLPAAEAAVFSSLWNT